ncbi:MAG: hypothetical protein RJA72_27, partial [Pseudomonadota bacterium]
AQTPVVFSVAKAVLPSAALRICRRFMLIVSNKKKCTDAKKEYDANVFREYDGWP